MMAPVFSWPHVCTELELEQWEEYFGTTAAAVPPEHSGLPIPCLEEVLRVAKAARSLTALDVAWGGAEGAVLLFLQDTEMSGTLWDERKDFRVVYFDSLCLYILMPTPSKCSITSFSQIVKNFCLQLSSDLDSQN